MRLFIQCLLDAMVCKLVVVFCGLCFCCCCICHARPSLSALTVVSSKMSLVMRKPEFCKCENKDADQLRGNCEADQRLCFRYTDSTIPLLSKSKISSLQPSSVVVQPGLCRTLSETLKTGFLTTRLKYE